LLTGDAAKEDAGDPTEGPAGLVTGLAGAAGFAGSATLPGIAGLGGSEDTDGLAGAGAEDACENAKPTHKKPAARKSIKRDFIRHSLIKYIQVQTKGKGWFKECQY
jgi:hypothetical protein